jgi:hypothetical protein
LLLIPMERSGTPIVIGISSASPVSYAPGA